MGIADHQLYPLEAPRDQAAQKLQPEGVLLTRPDRKAHDFALSGLADANPDHHRCTHNAVILAHLHIEGIQPQIGIGALERALAKLLDHPIELLTDARDAHSVDPRQPQGFEQVIDRRTLTPSMYAC